MQRENLRQPDRPARIIISGGGTGGHIFPAIAIAHALKSAMPDIELLFVGAEGRMEMEKVPAAGYRIIGLPIAGIKRELSIENLSFPLKLVRSLQKAKDIVKEFKPDVAIGVGGYASGPLLFAASRKQIPILIQEQNSFPGITNKILARWASRICVAYENMDRFFPASKIVFTGNPVREDLIHVDGKRSEAISYFGLDPEKPVLLVVGGSQGARSINRAILQGLPEITSAGVQLVWQTGKGFIEEARRAVTALRSEAIKVFDFIGRMDLGYAISDVVVARAGASTVSELCIVRKPALLVPLPTAAEDHQTKNCMALVERDAAILVPDSEAQHRLVVKALALVTDEARRDQLSANISPLARPDAAKQIAAEVLTLIGRTTS